MREKLTIHFEWHRIRRRKAESAEAKRDDSELHRRVYGAVQLLEQMSGVLQKYGRHELQVVPRRLLRMRRQYVHKLRDQRVKMHALSAGEGGRGRRLVQRLRPGRGGNGLAKKKCIFLHLRDEENSDLRERHSTNGDCCVTLRSWLS